MHVTPLSTDRNKQANTSLSHLEESESRNELEIGSESADEVQTIEEGMNSDKMIIKGMN